MSVRAASLVAAFVPFVAYLATSSGTSYWLDAGELVAAAFALDIAHPPGHPLASLYGKLFCLLPFGSIPFRVALGQAVAGAFAASCVFRAAVILVDLLELRARTAIGLAAAWLFAFGFGVWFQCVRSEVYALQSALLAFALEHLLRACARAERDPRALYAAAFAVGLGLCNHHLMAVLLLPALLFVSLTAIRAGRRRALWLAMLSGAVPLLSYVYLPIRAQTSPPANLGDPSSLQRLLWVVSARVYARDKTLLSAGLLGDLGELVVVLGEHLLWVFLPLAGLGLYALLRQSRLRACAGLVLVVCAFTLASRPLLAPMLGPIASNPDAFGYLAAGFATAALLGGLGFGLVTDRLPGALAHAAAWSCALIVPAAHARGQLERCNLSSFVATDELDELRERSLPARAVLVLTTPQTAFRHFELRVTEAVRPDLSIVALPFLGYPGAEAHLLRREPHLRPVLELVAGAPRVDALALGRLPLGRALFVELDPHVSPESYRGLLPAGLLHAVVDPRAVTLVLEPAFAAQRDLQARLYRRLGAAVREQETSRQLLHVHYMDALYYAALGAPALSRQALARALELFPADASLRALQRALDGGGAIGVDRLIERAAGSAP